MMRFLKNLLVSLTHSHRTFRSQERARLLGAPPSRRASGGFSRSDIF